MGQAVVPTEVIDLLRRRVLTQIGRGCAKHRATNGQLAGDQARVQVIAGANRQIDAFIHQIDRAIEHLQVDTDLRVKPHIVGDGRRQLRLAERGADADAQQPPWCITGHIHGGLHVVGQFQQLPTARQGFIAGGGQAQLARGAVHQACPHPFFKFGQIARNHRARQVQVISSS